MSIQFDAASSGSETTTTLTVSHTIAAGNNRILIVGQGARSNNHLLISATFNGEDLTLLETQLPVSGYMRFFYMVNPPVGTYDIVTEIDQFINHVQANASYSGVDQLDPIDVFAKSQDDSGSSNTIEQELTTTVNNAWLVAVGVDNTEAQSARTDEVQRAAAGSNMRIGFYDEGEASTPAGTFDIGFNIASPQTMGVIAAALRPAQRIIQAQII